MRLLSTLDIVNAACAEIGADPLQDLDEETIGGQSVTLIYENLVDFNLSIEPFEFKFDLRQLTRIDGEPPLSGFTYLYDVPGPKSGPPRWLTDDPTDPDCHYTRFRLIKGQVHAMDMPIFASVPFRPDPQNWEPAFRKATVSGLAAHLALSLASDANLHELLKMRAYGTPQENYRGGEMRTAINNNAQATPPQRIAMDRNPLTRSWRS
ncbi:hypothetical protein TRICHSKD4_4952 [Roseibium sp. TrichSKD4]|uniref:hypothetical protein n=1 Tax=Roseibium sp. TrichSKD4 TaxID=744980 RepID=UPI0001E57331|nr:hypothetical protein [Roseibium sp. TrichSKD4]EFO29137.1 hypothetical protein TRICHSKD4_4952 [Roseibium sp. TrichSKD4]